MRTRWTSSSLTLLAAAGALLLSAATLSACEKKWGCGSDSDCKGERICVERRCVWPAPRDGGEKWKKPQAQAQPEKVAAAPAAPAAKPATAPAAAPTAAPAAKSAAPPAAPAAAPSAAAPAKPSAAAKPAPDAAASAAAPAKTPDAAAAPDTKVERPVHDDPKKCLDSSKKNLTTATRKVGFKVTNACGKPITCKLRFDFYCPLEDDFSERRVKCGPVAPGETKECGGKTCNRAREQRLKRFVCSYDG